MLSYTSLFNNFGAQNFNLIPNEECTYFHNVNFNNLSDLILSIHSGEIYKSVFVASNEVEEHQIRNVCDVLLKYKSFLSWSVSSAMAISAHQKYSFIVTQQFFSITEDPRPFLLQMKKLGLKNILVKLVIFLDDCKDGFHKFNKPELIRFLLSCGFQVEDRLTHLSVSIDKENYKKYLTSNDISDELIDSHYAILTTEDSKVGITGGIGTYVRSLKDLCPQLIILNCNLKNSLEAVAISGGISPYLFNDHYNENNYINGFGLIEVIKCLLFLLPNISIVELQDFLGYGFRILQARETGQLPHDLFLKVFLHGSIDHVKYAAQDAASAQYNMEELQHIVKDSYTFKNVDEVIAPSKYIAQSVLQDEFGYEFSRLNVLKLPYSTKLFAKNQKSRDIRLKKLIFVGKYVKLKGWNDFIDAVGILSTKGELSSFEEIISICPQIPRHEEEELLKSYSKYSYKSLSHKDFIQYLEVNKNEVLFIVPAGGESYSLLVLELMLSGCMFIAYDKGAIPEVVEKDSFKEQVLCHANAHALAEKICSIIKQDASEVQNIYSQIQLYALSRQKEINQQWLNHLSRTYIRASQNIVMLGNAGQDVTLAIPIYNTKLEYVEELINSINYTTCVPAEVLFIDDGSLAKYKDELIELISCKLSKTFNYRVISQPNKGLAGARNRALSEAKTKYLAVLDSDDLLLPNSLLNLWMALELDSDLVATAGFHADFRNFDDINNTLLYSTADNVWKPLGTNLGRALSLCSNQNMSANCMIRVEAIRKINGWDDKDKATWEDWAFYNKLAWLGYKFTVTPTIGCLYRRNPHSMSQTYNTYFGKRRIIRNLPGLTKLDATIITNLIQHSKPSASFECSETEKKLILKIRELRTSRLINLIVKLILKLNGM
jgi:glycosyltransferase involved in cell wall biosynthesis